MKKLTKKQRNKAYIKAYESILNSNTLYICKALAIVVFGCEYDWEGVTEELFPELYLFKPHTEFYSHKGFWGLTNVEIQTNERLTALGFMIAMTE